MAIETPTAPAYAEREPRDVVVAWRVEQLMAAGYAAEAAFVLALDREVDLHAAISLLQRGCPPNIALEILF